MTTEIFSPMPGKIIEVLVSKGDKVIDGQELMIVEAMKMENPICATSDGIVKKIAAGLDDQVEEEQLLFEIE